MSKTITLNPLEIFYLETCLEDKKELHEINIDWAKSSSDQERKERNIHLMILNETIKNKLKEEK